MIITHSPDLLAAFPELDQKPAPLPPAIDEIYRDMFQEMHPYGDLNPKRDMIEYMRMVPKDGYTPEEIKAAYVKESKVEGFSHEQFLTKYFDFPIPAEGEKIKYTPGKDLDEHVKAIMLGHLSTAKDGPITIGTTKPGIASGGRYSDGRKDKGIFYYWDQAAIVDALDVLGLHEIADGIVEYIRDQIIKYKRPPFNANAPEYVGRSQPPIYIRLVRRDVRMRGDERWRYHLPALLIEHAYLMEHSTVVVQDGEVKGELNVFSAKGYTHKDGKPRFRPESFPAVMKIIEEFKTVEQREPEEAEITWICEQDHSGAGAGTDFAGWMLGDPRYLHTLRTTKRVAPFQQALMFELECGIAEGLEYCGFESEANEYKLLAFKRAQLVEHFNYDPKTNYYYPYDVETGLVRVPTLQDASFMLESGMIPWERTEGIFKTVRKKLRRLGGFICSAYKNSKLSWDNNIWGYMQQSLATAAWRYGNDIEDDVVGNYTLTVQASRERTGFTIERYKPGSKLFLLLPKIARPLLKKLLGKPGGGGEYKVPERNFVWTDASDTVLRHRAYRNEYEYEAFLRRQQIARGVGIIGVNQVTVPASRKTPKTKTPTFN
jgi:alpha,alpha-trehalase